MKKLCSLVLFAVILFSGCTQQAAPAVNQPNEQLISLTASALVTQSPIPSTVPSSIPASITLTPTTQPTKLPTETPFVETYPLKKVWIEFGSTPNGHADYEFAFPLTLPAWVLYSDGTLIQYRNTTFQTKDLSKVEICGLLAKIEQLGFYEIESDGTHYQDDPIYVNFPPENQWTDSSYEYLVVNGSKPKRLWVYSPGKDYVIEPVKAIMDTFGTYSPVDMQPYKPDRLALYIARVRPYSELEKLEAQPWPFETIPLIKRNEFGALYIEGEMAAQVFAAFKKPYQWLGFTDKGQKHSVIAHPLLPNERRTDEGVEIDQAGEFEPPFICE